jgi:hypothetical protein
MADQPVLAVMIVGVVIVSIIVLTIAGIRANRRHRDG